MLLRAAQKCAGHFNIVVERGSVLELPFQDRLFDGVMINQVLHHLSASSDLQQYRQCLAEVFRVLKSGGVLCINTCSQEQLKSEGPFWYFQVFPEAARYSALKYAQIGDLLRILCSLGFTDPVVQTQTDECFFAKEQYYDVEGPFRKEWRNGDSAFVFILGDSSPDCYINPGFPLAAPSSRQPNQKVKFDRVAIVGNQ